MMKKICIATLGSYLLGKKTIFLPQGGVVRAECLEPTDANIELYPMQTRLYGRPEITKNQHKKQFECDFTEDDHQQEWGFDQDWDALEGTNPPNGEGHNIRRFLHFYAAYEQENSDHTPRGSAQYSVDLEQTPNVDETRKVLDGSFVKGFPVHRTKPPHSDLTVRGSHDAKKDFWAMEYAFRKVCHRFRHAELVKTKRKVERYFEMPKNLIAYFVQRIMQFPPETFGRFRISDGSHTCLTIDYNGKPKIYYIGITSHFQAEYVKRNVNSDRGLEDVGLDVPAVQSDDHSDKDDSDSDGCDSDNSDDNDSSDDDCDKDDAGDNGDSDDNCDDGFGDDGEPSKKKIKFNGYQSSSFKLF